MEYTSNMKLLQYIYQNAKIGSSSLKIINSNYKNKELNNILENQIKNYDLICKKSTKELNEFGQEAQNTIQIPIIITYSGIKIEINDTTTKEQITNSLLKTTVLGIIDIQKILKQHSTANKNILLIAKELLTIEENFSKQLKLNT